jgi:hypothetical protein
VFYWNESSRFGYEAQFSNQYACILA